MADDWEREGAGATPDSEPEPEHPAHLPAPWESEDFRDEADPSGRAPRHDAFTPARRRAFLKALARSGCILDACRKVGVSNRTVYNHQGNDQEFANQIGQAIRMAGFDVETTAWQRAVVGVREEVVCGGKVITRVKYSDSLLRLLLQGSDPKKYGPRPGFSRKRLMKWERKEIERQVRQEMAAKRISFDQAMEMLEPKLAAFGEREDREKLDAGWTKTEEGHMIPPGWVRIGDAAAGTRVTSGEEDPVDSL